MGALNHVRLRLVETFSDASDFMRWLGERREILAVDTETGGLDWWRDPLRMVQIGDADTGWAIPWQLWGGLAKEALERYEGDVVLHNAAFDLRFLHENGVNTRDLQPRVHDTSVMAHILDSTRPRGLKKLGETLIDRSATRGQELLDEGMSKNRWTWATVPLDFPPYWAYAALDVVITARLHSRFMPEIRAAHEPVCELEMAVQHVLNAMERRGLLVDQEYANRKRDELEAFEGEMREYVKDTWGVSASSNGAVAKALLESGAPLTKQTKSGNFSVDEEVLVGLGEAFPLADCVLKVRQAVKTRKSYFEAILRSLHDGRVHPGINPLGARTGRMSVSRPPLQQLPSDSPLVRDCFIPSKGNSLLSVDYDQIELRVLAHYANERSMIDAIHAGEDLHTSNARMIFGPDAQPRHRKFAKTGAFAKVYGAGSAKLAAQLGIPLAEASAFMARFDASLPGVATLGRELERVIRDRQNTEGRGYIKTFIGRRSYVDKGKEYTGLNYLCQGTAADILKMRIVALDNAGLADYALLPVHDELIFEVPEKAADELLPEIQRVMTDAENFVVPIGAAGKVLTRWGDPYREEG